MPNVGKKEYVFFAKCGLCLKANKKSLPLYGGEANQMFSQRNNPYCE